MTTKTFELNEIKQRLSETLTVELHDLYLKYKQAIKTERIESDGYRTSRIYLNDMKENYPSDPRRMIDMREGHEQAVIRYENAQAAKSDVEHAINCVIDDKALSDDELKHLKALKAEASRNDKKVAKQLAKHVSAIERLLKEDYPDVYAEMADLHRVERLNQNINQYKGLKTERPNVKTPKVQTETDRTIVDLKRILKPYGEK